MESAHPESSSPPRVQAGLALPASEFSVLAGAVADVRLESSSLARLVRKHLIEEKNQCEVARNDAASQLRRVAANGAEKADLYRRIRSCADEERRIEELIQTELIPQHGPSQFLGPRVFLQTPLFRVAGKQFARQDAVSLLLSAQPQVTYRGPELRQSDGLVFASLLHMGRDVRLGTAVSFHAEPVCRLLFGRYDGNTRRQLRDHIQRLQSGVVVFNTFSVQLCLRFDYPARGRWSVALDPHIISLFEGNTHVWMDIATRVGLPEGLTSWLYCYVRSQTRLIPMALEALRQHCGSDASPKAFMNGMRLALQQLALRGVVAPGWLLGEGKVRWMKGPHG